MTILIKNIDWIVFEFLKNKSLSDLPKKLFYIQLVFLLTCILKNIKKTTVPPQVVVLFSIQGFLFTSYVLILGSIMTGLFSS